MSIRYGFYNSVGGDRKYDARDMAEIFNGIINNGVFASVGGALAVSPGGDMNINVADGRAWFHGTWTSNDSVLTLPVDQAGLGLARIDVVILEINAYADTRANTIKILKGIPSSNPVAPTLVNDELLHQIPLAHISIPAGTTVITGALITNYIGTGICPFVTGILSVINIDMLIAQWDNEFNTWFASLENILDENTAANLLNMINNLETSKQDLMISTASNMIYMSRNQVDSLAEANDYIPRPLSYLQDLIAMAIKIKNYGETHNVKAISGGVLTIDLSLGNSHEVSLSANITSIVFQNWKASGTAHPVSIKLVTGATARAITIPSNFKWINGIAPTNLSQVNKHAWLTLVSTDGGVTIDATAQVGFPN